MYQFLKDIKTSMKGQLNPFDMIDRNLKTIGISFKSLHCIITMELLSTGVVVLCSLPAHAT